MNSINLELNETLTTAITDPAYKRINVALLGRSVSDACFDQLVNDYGSVKYRDACNIPLHVGEAWLFDYAVLVCWGADENDRKQLIERIIPYVQDPLPMQFLEQFSYTEESNKNLSIHNDIINLPNDFKLTRLALSHAFAQSSKLVFFEEQAERVIRENKFVSKELAKTGRIPLSRVELAKLRGVLFDTSSDISLHFNLLDTPEFFWNYPDKEEYYLQLIRYLDLQPRIQILNHKLSTIHGLLEMLAAEQNHKHSALLEWIIIILIAFDIAVYFVPK